jgi:hypothetical protein
MKKTCKWFKILKHFFKYILLGVLLLCICRKFIATSKLKGLIFHSNNSCKVERECIENMMES